MAKRIDKIIQSKKAPESNNVLWDDGENLKISRNGEWERVGKSDWNAQEGEPGYIENRTHYINTKEGEECALSDLNYIDINEDGGKEWYYHGGLYTYSIVVEDYDGVLKSIDIIPKEEVLYDDGNQNILTVKLVEENYATTIVFRAEYSGYENFKFLLFENVNPVITLDPQYIPYTIARTKDVEALKARIAALEAKLNS